MGMAAILVVWLICKSIFSHVSKSFEMDFGFKWNNSVWEQQQQKISFNFETSVTFGQGQSIYLTFDTHLALFSHLV